MKVLLVSIASPPKRDPESLQVAKYCKYLNSNRGIELRVLTSSNPTLFMEEDATLNHYLHGLTIAKEIKIFENKYVNYLIRKIGPSLLQYPDSKFSFWRQYHGVFQSIEKPELLYSRSYPISSTLLALKLKKKWDVPWVIHLSDPWAIASTRSLSPATKLIGKAKEWNKRKEEECFDLASKVCLTSLKTIELYARHYPYIKDKFEYMPNVFDNDLIVTNPYKKNEVLTFVYTGGFGEARSPATLLEAIRKFWMNSNKHEQVQFLFTGEASRYNNEIFDRYKSIPIIKHLGVIPHTDVVKLQRSADILINIDSNIADAEHSVFFPSKLLDYMAAQRRILAITNKHSTTFDVVNGKHGDCFDFDEIDELTNYFDDALNRHKNGESAFFYSQNIPGEFSAENNATRLAKIFFSLKN